MGKKSRSTSQKSTPVGTPTKVTSKEKTGAKASPKTAPAKSSEKTSPKASPKASPKTAPKASPKAAPKASPKGSPKAAPKSSPKTAPKSSPKGSPKASPKGSPKASKVASKEQNFKSRIVHALEQLKKYEERKNEGGDENNLLGGDEELGKYIQLIAVNNTSFTGTKKDFKPKLLDIKHSLFAAWKKASVTMVKDFKILLILKDSDAGSIEAEQVVEGLQDTPELEIIAAKELKTVHKAYEARRAFLSEFSLILADDSVITTLPKLLGGKAYNKLETTPIPIKTHLNGELSLKTIKNKFEKIYQSKLPVILPRGTTMNVHLGHFDWLSTEELADNAESIIGQLKEKYSIRSVFIKSTDSPAIPLYYNQDVIDEIAKGKDELKKEKSESEPFKEIEIDGVKVTLSQFDSALAEVANPEELKSIFRHKLKRSQPDEEEDQENKEQESSSAPKAKKAKA
ncbi:hypothetical protein ZYGR_0AD04330 [Zygosaccharomyces rouxii]|uniref:ZYRO0G16148p n=2 Tax=Zygosaccharomyces rouxii TaxID=4956 RepID=C5E0W5_ZYGRC|nr:uncharacterized protein ZYRO0G16148g [Zygosaccharomyces rouxii]KAH9202741.1 ribosomal protein L1p/L10e family-domain-containing protein [Zygosaccharomyces rouxii]GAV51250.1 hypothetical protein ZYGR_0AD04330 [Zygosaccharomyces rouxii]CAR29749.1 ZYRO0G16148p [Zygosaccharomyces rouxii]